MGGGSAGCVVASRLSERFSVLLLEAGGEPPSFVEVPAFFPYNAGSSDINYMYSSVPQAHAMKRVMYITEHAQFYYQPFCLITENQHFRRSNAGRKWESQRISIQQRQPVNIIGQLTKQIQQFFKQ